MALEKETHPTARTTACQPDGWLVEMKRLKLQYDLVSFEEIDDRCSVPSAFSKATIQAAIRDWHKIDVGSREDILRGHKYAFDMRVKWLCMHRKQQGTLDT